MAIETRRGFQGQKRGAVAHVPDLEIHGMAHRRRVLIVLSDGEPKGLRQISEIADMDETSVRRVCVELEGEKIIQRVPDPWLVYRLADRR